MPNVASVHRRVEGERTLERGLDALAVARRGEPLLAQDPPLPARAERGAEVEPGLGTLGLARRPCLGFGDRLVHLAEEASVEEAAVRDPAGSPTRWPGPVIRGTPRAAPARRSLQDRRHAVEVGVERDVVGGGDQLARRQAPLRRDGADKAKAARQKAQAAGTRQKVTPGTAPARVRSRGHESRSAFCLLPLSDR